MEILEILKNKIELMNTEIKRLQEENEALKLELSSVNSQNNYLLESSEEIINNVNNTLKGIENKTKDRTKRKKKGKNV
jgi:hypothetical protein